MLFTGPQPWGGVCLDSSSDSQRFFPCSVCHLAARDCAVHVRHGVPVPFVLFCFVSSSCRPVVKPRSGELRSQKLKSHLVRTQSLNVLPLKPGVGQFIAIHATLTARDFFLAYFYTSGPFTCIFSKTSLSFSLCWLWLTHGSCVGPQNKIGHPAGCRFPCWVPAEYKEAKKNMTLWYDDLWSD